MQLLFIILFICFGTSSFGQSSTTNNSVTFCHIKYKVPVGCTLRSGNQLNCDDYSIVWHYVSEQESHYVVSQYIDQMTTTQKKTTTLKLVICYLLNKKVDACKMSIKKGKVESFKLVTSGVINGQPVFVELSLQNDPKTNSDIPGFARQIIRLME